MTSKSRTRSGKGQKRRKKSGDLLGGLISKGTVLSAKVDNLAAGTFTSPSASKPAMAPSLTDLMKLAARHYGDQLATMQTSPIMPFNPSKDWELVGGRWEERQLEREPKPKKATISVHAEGMHKTTHTYGLPVHVSINQDGLANTTFLLKRNGELVWQQSGEIVYRQEAKDREGYEIFKLMEDLSYDLIQLARVLDAYETSPVQHGLRCDCGRVLGHDVKCGDLRPLINSIRRKIAA